MARYYTTKIWRKVREEDRGKHRPKATFVAAQLELLRLAREWPRNELGLCYYAHQTLLGQQIKTRQVLASKNLCSDLRHIAPCQSVSNAFKQTYQCSRAL